MILEGIKKIPGEAEGFGLMSEAVEARLEVIEDELFKKGTLTGDSIAWDIISTQSREVLQSVSHMLAFRGIILALIERQTPDELVQAFSVGTVLFESHFPKLHPQGPKFLRKKESWANELISALTKGADTQNNAQWLAGGSSVVAAFCDHAKAHGFDVSMLQRVLKSAASKTGPDGDNTAKGQSSSDWSEAKDLDAKGRAQLRREIQSLAHKIFSYRPEAGISFAMRGYAGWLEFQFLPEADAEGKTQFQKMPTAVYEDHKRARTHPSTKELFRLEERLISNPDWFEGHLLAYDIAKKLGFDDAATAIRHRVSQRLLAWPGLRKLRYSNDAPFVSDEILNWINDAEPDTEVLPIKEMPKDKDESEDIHTLLASINAAIETAQSKRDKALAKLRLLQEFRALGHAAQAKMMAQELLDTISTTSAKEWDHQVVKDIEKQLK